MKLAIEKSQKGQSINLQFEDAINLDKVKHRQLLQFFFLFTQHCLIRPFTTSLNI